MAGWTRTPADFYVHSAGGHSEGENIPAGGHIQG